MADVHESMHRRVHQRVVHRSAREVCLNCYRHVARGGTAHRDFYDVHGNGDFHFVKPVTAKFVKFKILNGMNTYQCGAMSLLTVLEGLPESSRTYSSVYGHDAARIQAHSRSSLNSPQAWSAETNDLNQWVQMDLMTPVM